MNPLSKVKEVLGDISQYLLIFTAVIYAFGFFVINGYLSSFNLVTFQILKANYLFAGLLFFFSLSICIYLSWFFISQLIKLKQKIDLHQNMEAHKFLTELALIILSLNLSISALGSVGELLFYQNSEIFFFVYSKKFTPFEPLGKLVAWSLPFASDSAKFFIWLSGYLFIILSIIFAIIVLFIFKVESLPNKNTKPEKQKAKKTQVNKEKSSGKNYFFLNSLAVFGMSIAGAWSLSSFGYSSTQLFLQSVNPNNISNQSSIFGVFTSWITVTVYMMIYSIYVTSAWKLTSIKVFVQEILDKPQMYIQYVLASLLFSLILFGKVIYPKIPMEFGGGQPRRVYINFNKTYNSPVNPNTAFYLIDTTDLTYLFVESINKKRIPIEISKSAIDSIQTEK